MNTSSEAINSHAKYLRVAIKNLPDIQFRSFVVALTMAFNHQVFVDGSGVLSKTESLFSGIPGTTLFNIITSSKIQAYFQEGMLDWVNKHGEVMKSNFFSMYAFALDYVKQKTGFSFKGLEGLSVIVANSTFEQLCDKTKDQVFFDDEENLRAHGIPLPFLSNKLVILEGKPVCIPYNMEKFGASLVLPSISSFKTGVKSQIERVMGVAFSGGWVDQTLYLGLKNIFDSLRNSDKYHMGVDEVPAGVEEDVLEVIKYVKDFPSREFFYDLNTLSKQDFAERHLMGKTLEQSESQNKTSSSSSSSSKDEVGLGGTGGMEEFMEAADDLEDFTVKLLSVPPVPKSKMGHFNANDVEEDKAKEERRKIRYQKMIAARLAQGISTSGKAGKKAYSDIMHKLDNEDFDLNDVQDVVEDYFEEDSAEYRDYKNAREKVINEPSDWVSWQEYYRDDITLSDQADLSEEDELEDLYEIDDKKLTDENKIIGRGRRVQRRR